METALFNNRIVSVGAFQRARTSPADRAICPVCGEEVFLSAANSLKKAASFNHLRREEGDDRCSLSYPYHPKYAWLTDVDLEDVRLRAEILKANFYQLDNLKRAFTFLTSLTGKGAVNNDVFGLLLRRADKFDIWRYAGLPVWAVPYILLTFTDFYIRRPSKPTYVVRFVIDKPSRSKLNTTWLQPGQCTLVKYFVNNGKATKMFGMASSASGMASGSGSGGKVKNPLPFSEAEFNQLTSNTSWISNGLDNLLAEMAMEPMDEPDEDYLKSAVPARRAAPAATMATVAAQFGPVKSRDEALFPGDSGRVTTDRRSEKTSDDCKVSNMEQRTEPVVPVVHVPTPSVGRGSLTKESAHFIVPNATATGRQDAPPQEPPRPGDASTPSNQQLVAASRESAVSSAGVLPKGTNKPVLSPESKAPSPMERDNRSTSGGLWTRIKTFFQR